MFTMQVQVKLERGIFTTKMFQESDNILPIN